jgi:glycosyltransferase involved in cell wall biosynthesis
MMNGRLRVGVVAYEMEGTPTGVGRYVEGLLSGIAECDCDWEWLLFFKGSPFSHPLWAAGAERRTVCEPVFTGNPGAHAIWWEQFRLPSILRGFDLDLLFSPGYSLPPGRRLPSLVTIHDLSFESRPEEFPWKGRWRRRILARSAARRARRIFVDTQTIARELERTYRIDRERICVVPLGVEPRFFNSEVPVEEVTPLLAPYGIEPPYLLFTGAIFERRHVELVVAAFAVLASENPRLSLVLAGPNRLRRPDNLRDWITRSDVADRIIELGYVDERFLLALYRCAELSFYLSDYEGFGIPPLESLASGTPAIVSTGLALDDLWPDYPYRCPTLELETVLEVTSRALSDTDERSRVAGEGIDRMARLTWKRSAELFLTEAERALP